MTFMPLLLVLAAAPNSNPTPMVPYTARWDVKLTSAKPKEILAKLDLSGPALTAVKTAADAGNHFDALAALLDYYRKEYPLPPPSPKGRKSSFPDADGIVNHTFRWGPYEPFDYGQTTDWEADPRNDIEWVAAMYRFFWAAPLAEAYSATRDEKYVRTFVELTADWIKKNPLEQRNKALHTHRNRKGFAWLDIQTGCRATAICSAFKSLVQGKSFTPEFLGVLLSSLYDHQVKTEQVPMGMIHNKAIFEQRGFMEVAITFPEFKDSRRWLWLALDRVKDNLLAQTTPDGVQREWCGSYHSGVLRDADAIARRLASRGIPLPECYSDRIRKMYEYIFWMSTPDLGFPMFGDTSRPLKETDDRSRWPLYPTLLTAAKNLEDPKYAALAKLDCSALPRQTSHAFREAGFYVMRSDWTPQQIYFALHCSPTGISSHDQPDNGTFELCAYNRWLMTDTGFYTYGHDAAARSWHRHTSVHQTLTLDNKDSQVDARFLLWHTSPGFDALVVENNSYPRLRHRRSVWFVDRKFFVLLDEAIGDAKGTLDLHFQFAVGDVRLEPDKGRAMTCFPDANVLVCSSSTAPMELVQEEGWFAWKYGHRKPRTGVSFRQRHAAPAAYVTILCPYRGTDRPVISATLPGQFAVGSDEVSIRLLWPGRSYTIGRSLSQAKAWCRLE